MTKLSLVDKKMKVETGFKLKPEINWENYENVGFKLETGIKSKQM